MFSRKQRLKFDVVVELQEFQDVPFVNGTVFAKIRLLSGGKFTAESQHCPIQNNRVVWNEEFRFKCVIPKNANSCLEACFVRVSVRKETKGGRSYQKLGFADVNLSELSKNGIKGDSKSTILEGYRHGMAGRDNSRLKLRIAVVVQSMDLNFRPPPTRDSLDRGVQPTSDEDEAQNRDHTLTRAPLGAGTPPPLDCDDEVSNAASTASSSSPSPSPEESPSRPQPSPVPLMVNGTPGAGTPLKTPAGTPVGAPGAGFIGSRNGHRPSRSDEAPVACTPNGDAPPPSLIYSEAVHPRVIHAQEQTRTCGQRASDPELHFRSPPSLSSESSSGCGSLRASGSESGGCVQGHSRNASSASQHSAGHLLLSSSAAMMTHSRHSSTESGQGGYTTMPGHGRKGSDTGPLHLFPSLTVPRHHASTGSVSADARKRYGSSTCDTVNHRLDKTRLDPHAVIEDVLADDALCIMK